MITLTAGQIMKAVGGTMVSGYDMDFPVYGVATDSRKAKPGDVFFPLIGKVNDAHDYLGQVLENGCMVLVVSEPEKVPKEIFLGQAGDPIVIVVEDTTKALMDLASYYMSLMPIKHRIAVTGSVGKTSTRDMLYYVASEKYRTSRSIKNFNNEFGLPLSVLEFDPKTEAAVIEMGMSVKGSIHRLSEMVKPDIAVITNIGISHLENFPKEGREGILKTKLEVTDYFDNASVLIINNDNDMLSTVGGGEYRIVRVGSKPSDDFAISDVKDFGDKGISYILTHDGKDYEVNLPIPGAHNALNSALAIAAGYEIGVMPEAAIEGLSGSELTGKRLSVKEAHGIKVIDDSYNAAPDSMISAVNTLMHTEGRRHIAMLGDMFELGSESENGHKEVGAYVAGKNTDLAMFIGNNAKFMLEGWIEWQKQNGFGDDVKKLCDMPLIYVNEQTGKGAEYFPTKEPVMEHCMEHLKEGDVVLVKASNSMHLDKIVDVIVDVIVG